MKKKNNERQSTSRFVEAMQSERPNMLRYAHYRLGSREDAEDAVQDAFLMLCNREYDVGCDDIANLRSYLFRMLSNLCATRLRRTPYIQHLSTDVLRNLSAEQPGTFGQEYCKITLLLASIPDEQAEVIRLRIYGNKSFAEIAGILLLPLPTVKSRFRYGIDKIRKGMQPSHVEPLKAKK